LDTHLSVSLSGGQPPSKDFKWHIAQKGKQQAQKRHKKQMALTTLQCSHQALPELSLLPVTFNFPPEVLYFLMAVVRTSL
jgi:hypothetical protein